MFLFLTTKNVFKVKVRAGNNKKKQEIRRENIKTNHK